MPRILAKHACCEEKAAETLGKCAPVYKADEEKILKPWAKEHLAGTEAAQTVIGLDLGNKASKEGWAVA